MAALDEARAGETRERVAHGHPGDEKLLGQLAVAREERSRREFAVLDAGGDHGSDGPVPGGPAADRGGRRICGRRARPGRHAHRPRPAMTGSPARAVSSEAVGMPALQGIRSATSAPATFASRRTDP